MATPELAVLQGVCSYWQEGKILGEVAEKSWLTQMGKAFLDIEHGLMSKNRQLDKNYFRLKIAGLLLAKVLEGEEQLLGLLNSELIGYTSVTLPSLNWSQCFDCVSFLGLGPELTEIFLEMDCHVRNLVLTRFADWFSERRNCIATCSVLVLSVSLSTILFLICGKNVEIMMKQVEKLLRLTHGTDLKGELKCGLSDVEAKCQSSMIKRVRSQIFDLGENMKKDRVGITDVLYCNTLQFILSAATIQSIHGSKSESNAKDLLEKMISLKQSSSENIRLHNSVLEPRLFADYVQLTRECTKSMLIRSEALKIISQELLDLLHTAECLARRETSPEDLFEENSIKQKRKLHIIAHRLKGYESSVESLIYEMINHPTLNDSWTEAFTCLQNSIECVATNTLVISFLEGIRKCILSFEKEQDHVQKCIKPALSFQQLFWGAFHLLRVADKVKVTESILSNSSLSLLLSEYPLKDFETDSRKIQLFLQNQRKTIKLVFDGLMKETAIKDSVVEKFCLALLTSPEATIKKIVEHVLRSEQQAELMKNLSTQLSCVVDFRKSGSKPSFLWHCFCQQIVSYWNRNETSAIGIGLHFLHDILESEFISKVKSRVMFLEEIINSIAASLLEKELALSKHMETEQPLPPKLALQALSLVADVPTFFTAIALEKIVALCFTLGGRLENSMHFWNSDKRFDEEVHALLLENLEFLVSKSAEKLNGSEESGKSLLEWVGNVVQSFKWTTRLHFLPLVEKIEDFKLSVPACLSEVCTLPTILEPSAELSYGGGTGLLAWHQCFIANPSLCPLSSLDLENLNSEETLLFSHGWIVTMSQILPYCLANQWCTLIEISKLLISDFKLHIPFCPKHVVALPVVNMHEIHSLLGVVELLSQVFELLSKDCCLYWTSSQIWSHMTKCYCNAVSSLISDSAEFDKANTESQVFVLSQVFCSVCYIISLLDRLPNAKQSEHKAENLFILSLDLISTFEKIHAKVTASENLCEDTQSTVSGSEESTVSPPPGTSDRCYEKILLGISDRLQEMLHAIAYVPDDKNKKTLNQKLQSLVQTTKE